jgi:hypothetical protein
MFFQILDTDEIFTVKLQTDGETNAEKILDMGASFATCFAVHPQILQSVRMALEIIDAPESEAYKVIQDKALFILQNATHNSQNL